MLILSAQPARTQQGGKTMPVSISTGDKVTLSAVFYPGPKGEADPVVILLHGFNEDSSTAEWQGLAATLQAKGFAVIRFDFRGFGNSTAVEPGTPNFNPMLAVRGFWDEKENAGYVKGGYVKGTNKRAESIDAKNFSPAYYRILANDIEAVKAWLDSSGQCDTSKTILIGAKEGATIGALWLNAAWSCYRMGPDPQGGMQPVPDLANPEGAKVKAAVWLSISSNLGNSAQGGVNANVPSLLYKAATENKTPMLFFYSDGDSKGKTTAALCEKKLIGGDKKKYPLTAKVAVPKAGKFAGSSLLAESLGLQNQLPAYLDSALKSAGSKAPRKMLAGPNDPSVWLCPVSGRVVPKTARVRGQPVYFNFLPFWR
jgi:pimeloyl-ACP methyl ester carboxylesterase